MRIWIYFLRISPLNERQQIEFTDVEIVAIVALRRYWPKDKKVEHVAINQITVERFYLANFELKSSYGLSTKLYCMTYFLSRLKRYEA